MEQGGGHNSVTAPPPLHVTPLRSSENRIEMNALFQILNIVSRLPGLLFFFSALLFETALIGGLMGFEGPLHLGPYSIAMNTLEGAAVSLMGTALSIVLVWLFMVQIPYLCIQKLHRLPRPIAH